MMLFQAATADDMTSCLVDLQPALIVLDIDCPACVDGDRVASLLAGSAHNGRPQVMLLARPDDPRRVGLVEQLQPDVINDLPLDELEFAIEVRTLVRVRAQVAAAAHDRLVLNKLLELSTFSDGFSSTDQVLATLARRVGQWMGMPHVVLTQGPAEQPRVAAAWHKGGHLGAGRTLVDRRHGSLCERADVLTVDSAEGVLTGDDPNTLPYIGVPLQAHGGAVLGVLHAWGGQRLPAGDDLRLLRAVAERIGTEIHLRDTNRRLEEMVDSRMGDLTALLGRLRTVNDQLLEATRDTVLRLARAAESRDAETAEHVDRMAAFARIISRRLGMSAEEQALIELAAPMHDVGKIGIPDAILRKQDKLTEEEWLVMRQHPTIGANILSGSRSKLLQMAERIAASHHERWDGTGYPNGLQGTEIPLAGRIVALADVFDALTSPRAYKDAWSVQDAVSHVRKRSGTHFDPRVVGAFEQGLDELLDARARYVNGQAGTAAVVTAAVVTAAVVTAAVDAEAT